MPSSSISFTHSLLTLFILRSLEKIYDCILCLKEMIPWTIWGLPQYIFCTQLPRVSDPFYFLFALIYTHKFKDKLHIQT